MAAVKSFWWWQWWCTVVAVLAGHISQADVQNLTVDKGYYQGIIVSLIFNHTNFEDDPSPFLFALEVRATSRSLNALITLYISIVSH